MQIYCDLDGVLADLDTHYKNLFGIQPSIELDNLDWNLVRESKGFYAGIPLMPDAQELWDFIAPFSPIILTGVPKAVEEATENKQNWVRAHFGADVEVRCVRSSEKYLSAKPGDVLIDDWEKYRAKWSKAGGVWITHTSAERTIKDLICVLSGGVEITCDCGQEHWGYEINDGNQIEWDCPVEGRMRDVNA